MKKVLFFISLTLLGSLFAPQTFAQQPFWIVMIWSPSQDYIAVGDETGQITIYDANSGHSVKALNSHTTGITELAWYSDDESDLLASADTEENIFIHNVETGTLIHSFSAKQKYWREINQLSWNGDGSQIISVAMNMDTPGDIRIWDIASESSLMTLTEGDIMDLEWDKAHQQLAFAGIVTIDIYDNDYNYINGFLQPENTGLGFEGISIDWHPNGLLLAAGAVNGSVRLWDVATREFTFLQPAEDLLTVINEPTNILDLRFSSDGSTLATIREDGQITVWNWARKKIIVQCQLATTNRIRKGMISVDASQIVTVDAETNQIGFVSVPTSQPHDNTCQTKFFAQ